MSKDQIELNGIEYNWPKKPVVVVCIAGGAPEYIDKGIEDGIIPNIETLNETYARKSEVKTLRSHQIFDFGIKGIY